MNKPISILDKDYLQWIKELSKRYRQSQIKAAVKVNTEMLKFYWSLGRDIVALKAETRWGSKFFNNLSRDLKEANPLATCFSPKNLLYMKNFYCIYLPYTENGQQVADQLENDIFSTPWGHHMLLIDKFLANPQKALFKNTLPDVDSDLAQELTKDPYNFAFTGITKPYNERILKDALLNNITKFLTELGTGFAYVGKEYRLQIGEKENFIDLLFYNLNLSCYIVLEVKIGSFTFADVGQLGGYVVACNHLLRKEGRDNPTIGILICKEKDRIQAQYALESSSQPIAISEYDLEKFYPEKLEGTMPTIEEWEAKLGGCL